MDLAKDRTKYQYGIVLNSMFRTLIDPLHLCNNLRKLKASLKDLKRIKKNPYAVTEEIKLNRIDITPDITGYKHTLIIPVGCYIYESLLIVVENSYIPLYEDFTNYSAIDLSYDNENRLDYSIFNLHLSSDEIALYERFVDENIRLLDLMAFDGTAGLLSKHFIPYLKVVK